MSGSNTRIVIGPNASLGPREALRVMMVTAAVALTIGLGLTVLGFWPVLPFVGLELVALVAAIRVTQGRNQYREMLTFTAERVTVDFGWMGRGIAARIDWSRGFTRVALEPGPHRNSAVALVLMCGGQRVSIGRCLGEVEREALYGRIKQLLPPVWSARLAEVPGEGPAEQIPNGG